MSSITQRSFSGGELAPALGARVDQSKYATGLRTLRNLFVLRHGGAANRPGTSFVAEVKDSSEHVRLIPFVFNAEQTYMLEFGDLYMRVILDGSPVLGTSINLSAVTKANPAVATSIGHGFTNGERVYISSVGGMTELNGRWFLVAGVTANTFQLQDPNGVNVNSTSYTTYTAGGTAQAPYEIATPYAEADLAELQYVQSADVITITHRNYAPRTLSRSGHAAWTLSTITFAPSVATPTGLSILYGTASPFPTSTWVVTAVSASGEESLPTAATANGGTDAAARALVTFTPVAGAVSYNIYRERDGVFGFVGSAGIGSFSDEVAVPDLTDAPPAANNPFSGAGNYPAAVNYIQQRLMFASTENDPEKAWGSRTAQFYNFTSSTPSQDDDALSFTLAGRQVNEVRHLLDLGTLVLFTSGGEWSVGGDSSGVIRPTDINLKQHGYSGASTLPPLVIGNNALYVQARGSIVRDLGYEFQSEGYRGNDLTVFSAHLFDGYSLTDWAYQQVPHSVVWAVRDDGTLLGFTYVREHEVRAWHRHDFDGTVENVSVIPEGNEDVLYLVINRTVDGATKRYIERLNSRRVTDETILDAAFMDASQTYDGRNTDATHTMTLSGGSTWAYDETLTLTHKVGGVAAAYFTSADVGNAIHLYDETGDVIRFTIEGYSSTSVVTGKAHKTVPVTLRTTATGTWTRAVDQVTGLWHLEGKDVSVFADGFVVASPMNDAYDILTVEDGAITLPAPYGVIHVGLPITSDMETLNIDTATGETLADKKMRVAKVTLFLENTRGVWVGGEAPEDDETDPLENLTELKLREDETQDEPTRLATENIEQLIDGTWNSNGRIFIRQVDPLPMTILAVAPAGDFPVRQAGGG